MPVKIDLEVKGLSDIEKRLTGLGKAASTRVVRNVTGGAGRHMAKAVKQALPRKGQGKGYATGGLRRAVGYRQVGATFGVVRVKKPAGAHWHLYEYGTLKQPATMATTQAVNQNINDAYDKGLAAAVRALDREYTKLGIR